MISLITYLFRSTRWNNFLVTYDLFTNIGIKPRNSTCNKLAFLDEIGLKMEMKVFVACLLYNNAAHYDVNGIGEGKLSTVSTLTFVSSINKLLCVL